MPSIFVDANIILGFWSLSDWRTPSELLLPLVELRNEIFITQQIAEEVKRNKLSVYLRNNSHNFSLNVPSEYPNHMMDSKQIAKFNKDRDEFRRLNDSLKQQWNDIHRGIVEAISADRDLPTQMLSPLMKMASPPNKTQIAAAQDRRERGNPPGKKTDSLGDQLSWQQFLDAVKGNDTAWIITRDSDYAEKVGKKLFLNTFLMSELVSCGIRNAHVFDGLAEALKALKAAGLGAAPKLEEGKLDQLAKEEAQAQLPRSGFALWPDGPWRCPVCHEMNQVHNLVLRPSSYGGFSYWKNCRHCGFTQDTGEPHDD